MRRGRPRHPDILTARQWQVLELLRQGLTNDQIARRLGLTLDGAKYHVSEIITKLGVSSREEAAAWLGESEGRSRKAFSLGFATLVRKAINAVPASVIVALTAAAVILMVGLAVMSWRGSERDGTLPLPAEDREEALAAEGFLDLSQEAATEARKLLAEAELAFVAYATPSRQYTFRFFEPGTRSEVSILGPNELDPALPRWEIIQEQRPSSSPAPTHLDLTLLQNSFEAVVEEAAARSLSSASNMGIVVFNEGGDLTWETTARLNQPGRLIRCRAPDADRSLMRCDPPVPVEDEPPQDPTP